MSVYTVHEPPLRAAAASADPNRFVFVRDGFYVWGFLLTPLWLIRHRLWLVLVLYVVVILGLNIGLRGLGASAGAMALAGLLISLLIGFEGGTLRRFGLQRRGWKNVGVVSGDKVEDAELRFFDSWLRQAPGAAPSAAKPSPAPAEAPEGPGVVGLFPEPGAPR